MFFLPRADGLNWENCSRGIRPTWFSINPGRGWICAIKLWIAALQQSSWASCFVEASPSHLRSHNCLSDTDRVHRQMTIISLLSWILTHNHNLLSVMPRGKNESRTLEKLLIKAISGVTRVVNLGSYSGVTALCESGGKFGISCSSVNNTYITLIQFCQCGGSPLIRGASVIWWGTSALHEDKTWANAQTLEALLEIAADRLRTGNTCGGLTCFWGSLAEKIKINGCSEELGCTFFSSCNPTEWR